MSCLLSSDVENRRSHVDQLKKIGVVDEVIWEPAQGETHECFPIMAG